MLAVTGALFISAVLLISGRQNQAEFDQSIRQIQAKLQQTINEVSTGYYPNMNNFKCSAGAGGPNITGLGSQAQGTNSGCVFLGKVMQFRVHDTDPEQFATFTIAGLQKDSSGNEATNLHDAVATAVAPTSSNPTMPSVTQSDTLGGGLTTAWMKAGGVDVGAVGFMNSLASYSGGNIVSGSSTASLVPIVGSSLDKDQNTTAGNIDTYLQSLTGAPAAGDVTICFASGTTQQSGLITIGGAGRQLSVTLDIKEGTTC